VIRAFLLRLFLCGKTFLAAWNYWAIRGQNRRGENHLEKAPLPYRHIATFSQRVVFLQTNGRQASRSLR